MGGYFVYRDTYTGGRIYSTGGSVGIYGFSTDSGWATIFATRDEARRTADERNGYENRHDPYRWRVSPVVREGGK